MIVVTDFGHGEDTPGKCSPEWENGTQFEEWEFNRDVGNRILKGLKNRKIKTYNLVPEKHDIKIRERISRSYRFKDVDSILVSIHGNAATNPDANGVETLHYSLAGAEIAMFVQEYLAAYTGWRDRGLKKTYDKRLIDGKEKILYKVAITKYSPMPCILTESGFYTNFQQCQEMLMPEVRERIAEAHIEGITKYIQKLKYNGTIY